MRSSPIGRSRAVVVGVTRLARMPSPLLVVDAPSVLYRAFHALPSKITGAEGRPVNALLGGVNLVMREVERHEPRAVVMCFGPDAATYRVEAYPAYHAARPEMPADLRWQWERSPLLYEALGWSVELHDELEADDLLGSFATVELDAGGEALLLTGDRDLWQCVRPGCRVLYMRTGSRGAEVIDEAEVERRYGVPPGLVPDFIALRGDPSDGLPGAKGIGEKTAAELLSRHGSLEALLHRGAPDGTPRVRTALEKQAEELRSFRDIATLRHVPLKRPPDRGLDRERGAEAARSLGMERLAARLEGDG